MIEDPDVCLRELQQLVHKGDERLTLVLLPHQVKPCHEVRERRLQSLHEGHVFLDGGVVHATDGAAGRGERGGEG